MTGKKLTESLASFRMKKLEEAREKYGFNHVCTIDGCIMFKNGSDKPTVYGNRIRSFVCVIRAVICS